MIPFWSSFVVRTYALVNLLADGGPLATLISWLHLGDDSPGILYSSTAIAIGIVYSYLPLMILPLFVALERIDPNLLHAAHDLGASRWRVVPPRDPAAGGAGHHRRLHPGRRAGDGRVRDPRDPGRREDADARQRHRRPVPQGRRLPVRRGDGDVADGAADGDPGLRPLPPAPATRRSRSDRGARAGWRWSRWRSSVCLWAPIAIVAINSVNSDERLISWGGFTTQWFEQALDNERVRDAFVTSLQVALLSTIVSLAIAITASLWARRASARSRRPARRDDLHADHPAGDGAGDRPVPAAAPLRRRRWASRRS